MTSSKPITGPDLLECVGAAQIKSKVCKTGRGVGCSSPCGPRRCFLNPGQLWNDTELAAYLGVVTVGYWDNNNKHTQAGAQGCPRNQCGGGSQPVSPTVVLQDRKEAPVSATTGHIPSGRVQVKTPPSAQSNQNKWKNRPVLS